VSVERAGARLLGRLFRGRGHRPTGIRKVAGLRGRVEVLTDQFGVPSIQGDRLHDLFFAQGYLTAQERFFQMDYGRQAMAGRLSELIGNRPLPWRSMTVHLKERSTLDADLMLRTFGMRRAAEASLPLHSPDARAILEAYSEGVNLYLGTHGPTIEHRLLRVRPEPWTPIDSLSLIRGMAFQLNFAWRAILLSALLERARLPENLAALVRPYGAGRPGGHRSSPADWTQAAAALTADLGGLSAGLGFGPLPGAGSNALAVAGSHTTTGGALLANDTHLIPTVPVPWHEVHLHGGGLDVGGFAVAGVPGIGIGHTPRHAWGITAGQVQQMDIFMERLRPSGSDEYLTPNGWQPLDRREEIFRIRGGGYQRRTLFESRHGPLLAGLATEAPSGHGYSIAWCGNTPGPDFESVLGFCRATSFETFAEAARTHVCPTFNILYAGAEGDIGYVLAGRIPRRRPGTPLCPLEGWTEEYDWQGAVPFEENPRFFNPPSGFIVSANTRMVGPDYPHELGDLFEPSWRYHRMTRRLEALGHAVAPEDVEALQLDCHSAWGLCAREALLRAAGGEEELLNGASSLHRSALTLWLEWDGQAVQHSGGAAIAFATIRSVARTLLRRLAGEDAAVAFLEMEDFALNSLLALLHAPEPLAARGIDLRTVVRQGFDEAVASCCESMGSAVAQWRWGALHALVMRHPFDSTVLGRLFSIGPVPADGGIDTVNRAGTGDGPFEIIVAPAMRMVVQAGSPEGARTVVPGGQSGVVWSPHYDDQMTLFLQGQLKPADRTITARPGGRAEIWDSMKSADMKDGSR
jgi:penicillin amidase